MARYLRHLLVYLLAKHLSLVFNLLPRRAALFLGRVLGSLAFFLSPKDGAVAFSNLCKVYGEENRKGLRRLAIKSFSELGANLAEVLRMSDLDSIVEIDGGGNLFQSVAEGRGAILISGHLGCWELIPPYLASRGLKVYPITQTVYDGRVDSLIRKMRAKRGVEGIDKTSGLKEAVRVLRRREALGILIDQGSGKDGIWVEFFGRKTKFPTGPVSLSLKTGAPIVPVAIRRREDQTHLIQVGEQISLRSGSNREETLAFGTRLCAKALEQYIQRQPAQWIWSYPRWA